MWSKIGLLLVLEFIFFIAFLLKRQNFTNERTNEWPNTRKWDKWNWVIEICYLENISYKSVRHKGGWLACNSCLIAQTSS